MGIWVDSDQEQIDVYAWRLPVPAEERKPGMYITSST
jgi:hypothetical protein